jgi:hypothetical protein
MSSRRRKKTARPTKDTQSGKPSKMAKKSLEKLKNTTPPK